MLNRLILILLFVFNGIYCFSQDIPIGTWRDHLPYSDAISVSEGNGIVYCATNSALFTYNKNDGIIERLNLVTGLSDIGISKVKFIPYNGSIIVAYSNGNLDIIDVNKNITNIPFIKTSNTLGDKNINHIYSLGKTIYLSTGFGIVVLDIVQLEIIDSYLFGPLGNSIITNSITIDNSNIYAATNQGVYFANKNNSNLVDYNNWSLLSDLGSNSYNDVVKFSNHLFVSLTLPGSNSDSILYNPNGIWQKFVPNTINIENISTSNNNLIITSSNGIKIYNTSLDEIKNLYTINNWFPSSPKETTIDNEGTIWYADNNHGLIKSNNNWNNTIIKPNGPNSSDAFKLDFSNDELWVVSGGYGTFRANKRINHLSKGEWKDTPERILKPNGIAVLDLVYVSIDPNDPSHVFAGSWSSGLLEFNNGTLSNIYNESNSGLSNTGNITVTGPIKFDSNNNLWVLNSFTEKNLAVRTSDNNWYNFSFPGLTDPNLDQFHHMIIDKNEYKWIVNSTKFNILIFDDNKTINDKTDDIAILNKSVPGAGIFSIVEDLDGEIWVGTDVGIAVFYNPANVFNEDIQAERIYIQQDGQTQILLETEAVTVIKVDGANRKWIGTQSSGVYLMSEDGTEEIEHFTTKNSPLFSNTIFDIVIDPKTGEVFIATEKGLLSYKGTATDADTDFNNVFVYPNPVKPDFTGTIGIRGLVKDTDVRITDIGGNIVYQTTSLGGQAVWDGKDFNGNKVQTGVYMIFNGSPEGELKAVAKILFIH
tara:strand:+ start:8891 stop:11173 length:2283 start_codon:yes stop_codon:yes gene_type:complete